ncbi:MAG: FecR family protein [Mariprofundaceae bacterium]
MKFKLMVLTTQRWLALVLLCMSMMCMGGLELYAADAKVGSFSVIRGSVDALHEEETAPVPASKGMDAYMNDRIRSKHRSRARLNFTDGSILNMGANHMVNVKDYSFDKEKNERHVVVSALRGSIRATVAKFAGDSVFKVETPTAVVTVRGTDFIVTVGPDGLTTVTVISGIVTVEGANGVSVTVAAGQQTTVAKGKAPTLPVTISPAMMAVLEADTNVATAPNTSIKGVYEDASVNSENTLPVKVPDNLFQKVQTGIGQDAIHIQQAAEKSKSNAWTSTTPQVTEIITNLQGCASPRTWKLGGAMAAGANTCSAGGACTLGSACGGTCNAGAPAGPNTCSAGGACSVLGAVCGGICTAGAPGPATCVGDVGICTVAGGPCGALGMCMASAGANSCSVGGGACGAIGAVCGGVCNAGTPAGADSCSVGGGACTLGLACGGTCNVGTPAVAGSWACWN